MTPEQKAAQRRGRIRMLLIAAVFAMPVIASTLLFYMLPEYQPDDTTNYGQLQQPARPSEAVNLIPRGASEPDARLLHRIWSLVIFDDGACDALCNERLLMTRQMRLSLSDRRDRVQRVLVVPDAEAAEALESSLRLAHPDLRIVIDAGGSAADFFGEHPAGTLFLTDPLGNYLMRYAPDAEPKGLRKDIVRLLRASQIG
jgi:hypothetical protein